MKFGSVVVGLFFRERNGLKQQEALHLFLRLPRLLRTVSIHPERLHTLTTHLSAN